MQDEPSDQLPVRPPGCPDCMSPIRLVMSVPDTTYAHLQRVWFACDCGRASNHLTCELPAGSSTQALDGSLRNAPDVPRAAWPGLDWLSTIISRGRYRLMSLIALMVKSFNRAGSRS